MPTTRWPSLPAGFKLENGMVIVPAIEVAVVDKKADAKKITELEEESPYVDELHEERKCTTVCKELPSVSLATIKMNGKPTCTDIMDYVLQKSEAWNGYRKPPSEQKYSEDVGHIHQGLNFEPTREELNSLAKACSRLWELDMNRIVPGKDYRIDCGEGKKVYQKGDMASESLFSWLGDDVLRKPTYSHFCALLDNYNPHQDKHEEIAFVEEIARTSPIKYLHRYLVQKGVVPQDYEDFKRMLASLWFDLYGRGGNSSCSTAFEHVFVGEIKGRGQGESEFYLEEAKGNVDYQGYIFPRRRGESPDLEIQLLTVQFEWHGVLKSVSNTLIGVSPEFEVALYTL
ncbi:hypothetical protein ZEAMMB73_Zm00001d020599 [Zea mays]|uniref:EndoU domain-containing protein n=1 Tax=Zea mays TaxID=4577 RepID=A0A1D6I4Z1_MAIZE|nr:hypothetical protein ZEAMMB73_Zm00001d020599 [Zea mays]